MLKKVYVEITNVCNLACSFCHGTGRTPGFLSPADFGVIAAKLRPYTEYVYLHLLGEPLLHPRLSEILAVCRDLDYRVTLVTNGTLIGRAAETLLNCGCLYKLCYSLHAYEANPAKCTLEEYLRPILSLAGKTAGQGVINVFKLWNGGGQNALNGEILQKIEAYFGQPLRPHPHGYTAGERLYIDLASRFVWPDLSAAVAPPRFCMGLRDQLGVLCDGTAVPCCLDAEGTLRLGNLLQDSVEDVLNSPLAKTITQGFSEGRAQTDLCRRCDFAKRRFG